MSFGRSFEKKENLSESEQEAGQLSPEIAANQGDRWTFVGILPDSSFIHTLHHGARTLEQATLFVGKIKAKSDQASPLFASDDWFYEKALLEHYGMDFQPPYAGRGPYPKAIRVPLADLNYVQVQKKRDERGRLEEINYNIIYGTPQSVAQVFKQAERCKTINTVYVESRNGKFRKDDARLIRRTLCHSKKAIFGAARPDYGKI